MTYVKWKQEKPPREREKGRTETQQPQIRGRESPDKKEDTKVKMNGWEHLKSIIKKESTQPGSWSFCFSRSELKTEMILQYSSLGGDENSFRLYLLNACSTSHQARRQR